MTGTVRESRAFRAALVNGLLVFVSLLTLMLVAYFASFGRSWPPSAAIDVVKFGLVFATLAVIAAWRTWVHALRFLADGSIGWQGVAEAAACGLAVQLPYLVPSFLTLEPIAPRAVIVVAGIAAAVGCVVGLLLRATALAILKPTQSTAG
jgi:hypothetical protein